MVAHLRPIWNITHTIALREELMEARMRDIPVSDEPYYYWHVERLVSKKRRGEIVQVWEMARDFHGTKEEAAERWRRLYQGDRRYRLRLMSRLGA